MPEAKSAPATLSDVTGAPTPTTAPTLRWAVVLLAVETVATGVFTAYLIWEAATRTSVSTRSAWATPAFFAICAAILGGLAWALYGFRTWARGPAIVLEMLLIPLAYYMITGGVPLIGVPVLLVGLLGAGLLLAPSTRTALGMDI